MFNVIENILFANISCFRWNKRTKKWRRKYDLSYGIENGINFICFRGYKEPLIYCYVIGVSWWIKIEILYFIYFIAFTHFNIFAESQTPCCYSFRFYGFILMFIAKWDDNFFFRCVAYRTKSTQHTQNELIAQFFKDRGELLYL